MKSVFIKEQKRYTPKELRGLLECSEDELLLVLQRLKESGILKACRTSELYRDLSVLQEDDFEESGETDGGDFVYIFHFVGVIAVSRWILKCYPKYVTKDKEPREHLKQVMKVLEKYNSRNQTLHMFYDVNENKAFNQLPVLWFLLTDYFENGSYMNTKEIIETNGTGEVSWDRTIHGTDAFFVRNRPYYTDLQTQRRITNDNDYCKRLHECIVSLVSRELKDTDLLYIFGISEIDVSNEKLEDFGDTEEILRRIEHELNLQFVTRKQMVLKAIHTYVSHGGSLAENDAVSLFGTSSFYRVWEEVCADIFDNKLYSLLGNLDLPVPLCEGYSQNERLIDLIEKPYWSASGMEAKDTLIPDLVTVYNSGGSSQFLIFDAKYYVPVLNKGETPKDQPGIESVTKQYLYQLAFQRFVQDHKFQVIRNCFLLPAEDRKITDKGYVSMPMLDGLGLQKICVRFIPADLAYSRYLASEKIDMNTLVIGEPDTG